MQHMNNLFSLEGKTILITGASSGIGRQIAIAASQMGASVIITGRDENKLAQTKALLRGSSSIIKANLVHEDETVQLVSNAPQLDGVVFCAGVIDYTPVKFLKQEKIDSIFSINFNSQVLLTQQLLKKRKIEKGGSLVYVSSISAKLGIAGTAVYAASKAALNAFAKVTAAECAGLRIRSNTISPGIVITPMTTQAIEASGDDNMHKAADAYPLGYGQPEDIAGLAVYLLSDAGKWMTGSEIIMDGGLTLK
jgi:NAD(P)-dependent dehydrogenase (short-subunit alcohol dehydrogenase family)